MGLLVLLGVGLFAQYLMDARVSKVEVEGYERASEVSIRHLADIREGERLLSLELDHVVASVKQHPWVAEVSIERDFPDTVRVRVEEHKPALLLADRGLYFVSEQGEVFVRARGAGIDFPLLTGLSASLIDGQPMVAQRIIDDALNVLASVKVSSALDTVELSEIRFDEQLGFSLYLRNHSQIHLGFRSPKDQMARLEQMIRKGLDLGTRHEVDMDIANMAIATPLSG